MENRVLSWSVCFWLTFFNFHRNPPKIFWHPESETVQFWAKNWSFPFGKTDRYCFDVLIQNKFSAFLQQDVVWSWLLLKTSFLPPLSPERPMIICVNNSISFHDPGSLPSQCSSDHAATPCHSPHAHASCDASGGCRPAGEPGQQVGWYGKGDKPLPEKAAWFNKRKELFWFSWWKWLLFLWGEKKESFLCSIPSLQITSPQPRKQMYLGTWLVGVGHTGIFVQLGLYS